MKLSEAQRKALAKLNDGPSCWHNANYEKLHLGCLNGLYFKGLAEAQHANSALWRITDAGRAALEGSEK